MMAFGIGATTQIIETIMEILSKTSHSHPLQYNSIEFMCGSLPIDRHYSFVARQVALVPSSVHNTWQAAWV